jgi:hypothetical protein
MSPGRKRASYLSALLHKIAYVSLTALNVFPVCTAYPRLIFSILQFQQESFIDHDQKCVQGGPKCSPGARVL